MADQDYPDLYADMESSVMRVRTAALAYERTLGGGVEDSVPVNGYPAQPTIAKRVQDRINEIAVTQESAAMREINSLAAATSYVSPEKEILIITDPEGGKLATLSDKRLSTPAFEVASEDGSATILGDSEGGVVLYMDEEQMQLGILTIMPTDEPGVFLTDPEGAVFPDPNRAETVAAGDPFVDGLLFCPLIVTADGLEQTIHVPNLLPHRETADRVVATLASTTKPVVETSQHITVSGAKYGPAAVLNLRDTNSFSRKFMNLSLVNVPVQTLPNSPKILMIGDSIFNRQGALFLKQYLQVLGLSPVFIGTMKGAATANSANDASGELGEARESWETGDYTNSVTDRAVILPPGQEAAYMALTKPEQRDRNVFVRAATGADPVGIVRNGYVFDPAFYQTRFGLETPDIVIDGLGTNDVRDRLVSQIYASTLDDMTLMHNQIRAAWPNAKIIKMLPATAVTAERNTAWFESYRPLIQAFQKSVANRGDAKTILAPTWALTNTEGGYEFSAGVTGADGFYTGDWSDPVHPIQASRSSLFQALAPYVAAAALNLI